MNPISISSRSLGRERAQTNGTSSVTATCGGTNTARCRTTHLGILIPAIHLTEGTRSGACMKTHTRPIDGCGRVMGYHSPALTPPINDRGFFLASTTLRAVAHFIPHVFPLLAPLKWSAADRAGFRRAIARTFHKDTMRPGRGHAAASGELISFAGNN